MLYSELCEKDVISVRDCRKLGRVVDLDFDCHNGCICKIIVSDKSGILGWFFCNKEEYTIPFCDIKQIGPDIILVDC